MGEHSAARLAAEEAALLAADAIRSVARGGNLGARLKEADQPVTLADLEAERVLRARLEGVVPEAGWLSEESAPVPPGRGAYWLVDPLDGTRELLAGLPGYTVSVALVVRGEPVVGVIADPVTGRIWSAERGAGATCHGRPVRASRTSDLAGSRIVVSRTEASKGELAAFDGRLPLVPVGGMASKIAAVANGSADATFTLGTRHTWDVAAGVVILEEAGGIATLPCGSHIGFDPEAPSFRGFVASNGPLHGPLLRALRSAG